METKVPTHQEYLEYDGAHCFQLWNGLSDSWRCPACDRTKLQVLRWTRRFFKLGVGTCPSFMGWMAGLHRHHDHSQGFVEQGTGRFPAAVICDQCNASDGAVKRQLKLPEDFSFSPSEIGNIIITSPYGKHSIDLAKAQHVYSLLGI